MKSIGISDLLFLRERSHSQEPGVLGGAVCCSYKVAAEQKARTTYDNILRFCDDADVRDPIRFLRQRELTHFQRFGECLRLIQDDLDYKNFYAYNPEFDRR